MLRTAFLIITILLLSPFKLFAQAGALDLSFDEDGIVYPELGDSSTSAQAMVVDELGRITIGGTIGNGDTKDFLIVRLLDDGSFDPSWGEDGKVLTGFPTTDDGLLCMAIQPDGKVITAGYRRGETGSLRSALARYLPDGTLDSSFSDDGLLSFSGPPLSHVIVQPDGKILLIQKVGDGSLIRLNENGSFDPTFGDAGYAAFDWAIAATYPNLFTLLPSGYIVVCTRQSYFQHAEFHLKGFTSDGIPDPGFGTDGTAKLVGPLNHRYTPSTMLALPDGRFLVGGYDGVFINDAQSDMLLACFLPSGAPDPSFGMNGIVTLDLSSFAADDDEITDLALQQDGKILAGGLTNNADITSGFALVRFLANGTRDMGFGSLGVVVTLLDASDDSEGLNVGLQPDGKIVLSGFLMEDVGSDDISRMVAARYLGEGSTGVVEVSTSTWSVNPNPTTSMVTISYTHGSSAASHVRLLDLSGRCIRTLSLPTNTCFTCQVIMDLSPISAGHYLMEINADGVRKVLPVVRE